MSKFSEMIEISSWDEYCYAQSRGYEPMIDQRFHLNIYFRVALQRDLFGDLTDHNKFYCWVWDHRPHICEETMRPLSDYSAVHISHILTKGANPEMAHDPRNANILCLAAHNRWEFGDRSTMRIYPKNLEIIRMLRNDYQKLL